MFQALLRCQLALPRLSEVRALQIYGSKFRQAAAKLYQDTMGSPPDKGILSAFERMLAEEAKVYGMEELIQQVDGEQVTRPLCSVCVISMSLPSCFNTKANLCGPQVSGLKILNQSHQTTASKRSDRDLLRLTKLRKLAWTCQVSAKSAWPHHESKLLLCSLPYGSATQLKSRLHTMSRSMKYCTS